MALYAMLGATKVRLVVFMKFPGRRKTKHYFPVSSESRIPLDWDLTAPDELYIVGIDQLIVDVEAEVDDSVLAKAGLNKGESVVLPDEVMEKLTRELKASNKILGHNSYKRAQSFFEEFAKYPSRYFDINSRSESKRNGDDKGQSSLLWHGWR